MMVANGLAQADTSTRDAKIFQNHCASCHTSDKGGPHGQGPNLYGLLGRSAASASGYQYSPALARALKGKTWTKELLDKWLSDTQTVAPGAGMTYFQEDVRVRQAIISHIAAMR